MYRSVLVQRKSRNALNDESENLEIDVAIYELGARRIDQLFGSDHIEGSVAASPRLSKIQIRTKPRVVGHQFADGDLFFSVGRELGDKFPNSVIEPHLPHFQ